MTDQLTGMTLRQLSRALHRRECSSREVTEAYLRRIAQAEPVINAFLTVTAEQAIEAADRADRILSQGDAPNLCGIPVALKDNICTRGIRTTCGSRMLEHFVPPYSATAWTLLEQQGTPLLGKTNMDEFGMGSTAEHSAFHPTRNPRRLNYVPGGSSGGSAAAVAACEAPFALGSDTGGSVRLPAAFCGCVGLKPTYGTVSRYGLVAFASSLDQIGPLTRTVDDTEMVFDAITQRDSMDSTSVEAASCVPRDMHELTIGLPMDMLREGLSDDVHVAVMRTVQRLERLGAAVQEVRLPALQGALAAYYVISSAEASSNLARFDGIRYGRRADEVHDLDTLYTRSRSEGFGAEVKRRIILGTSVLSSGYDEAYYRKAQRVRAQLCREMKDVLQGCDALICPTAPTVAYPLGEKNASPTDMYMGDIYTVIANLTGMPALTLPCAVTEDGLPVGIQLMGKHLSERQLFAIGKCLEVDIGMLAMEVAV